MCKLKLQHYGEKMYTIYNLRFFALESWQILWILLIHLPGDGIRIVTAMTPNGSLGLNELWCVDNVEP